MAATHAIGSRESDRSTPPPSLPPSPPLPPTQAQAQQSRPDSSMSQASATAAAAADYAPSPNTSSLALTRANQLRIQALLRRLLLASSDLDRAADSHGESAHIDTLRVLRKTLREIDYNLSWLTQVDLLETLERILVANDESCTDINNDRARDQLEQRRRWRQEDKEDWLASANSSSSNNNNNNNNNNDHPNADDDQADDHNGGAPMQPVCSSSLSSSWRLIHDTSQLLLEALPRLRHEIGPEIIESIVPIAVENLGHSRSEVRRASLLLLNTLMRHHQLGALHFDSILRLFIDYGPANCRNKQAQRGAILSLPLLIGKPIVDSHNLLPLVRCLSALLVDDSNNNEQLFYSLYLALQRLHLMMGDSKFAALMSRCEPEAMHLYRQAASRHNSLVGSGECSTGCAGSGPAGDRPKTQDTAQGAAGNNWQRSVSNCSSRSPSLSPSPSSSSSQHVPVQVNQSDNNKLEDTQRRRQSGSVSERQPAPVPPPQPPTQPVDGQSTGRLQQHVTFENDVPVPLPVPAPLVTRASCEPSRNGRQSSVSPVDSSSSSTSSSSLSTMIGCNSPAVASVGNRRISEAAAAAAAAAGKRDFSSDVSSTCSSDAHLVNPAHYMTKAALHGNPLANYDQIHHIDHSQVDSLAINDFGPICNTPTMEVAPQLNYLTTIRSFPNLSPASGGNNSLLVAQQSAGGASLILQDDSLSRSELKFGILPRQLINISLNAALRSTDRYEAMQELMCIVRESPINHLAILMTYFDSFLEQFVAKLLVTNSGPKSAPASSSGATMVHQQTSLKLSLIAIDMLETIVIKTKVSTMQYIRPIVGLLLRALGHSHQVDPAPTPALTPTTGSGAATGSGANALQQAMGAPLSPAAVLMRENTCRVMHKMMAYLPPQHVIDAIFEHKHSRSPLVREESINRVTAACLEYDRNEFNLTKLCYHVLPMLADHAPAVRMAALECIATLAHILGPSRIGSLLTAAEAVQTNCDYDGLLSAIHARLLRHALPRCHSNGLIKYVIKPFLFQSAQLLSAAAAVKPASSNDTQQQQQVAAAAASVAADIRWVLEAPSSHQHSSGPYYHPHAHAHSHQGGQAPACSPLDIATGHVNYGPPVPGGATKHQHHRLGVYSPPSMAERRRRNSAINLIGATCQSEAQSSLTNSNSTQHFHEHHHAMHAQLSQQQQQKGADNTQDDCAITTRHRREQDPEEGRDRKASVSSKQQQQVKALRKNRRDSSRGEPAAGSCANDTTTRRQSASRSSRQSISTLPPQSKSDEVNQASSKVTTNANESSETKLVDERRESVQDANTACQRRPSCAHGRSRASSLARDTSGSSCLAGAKNDHNPGPDLGASNNNNNNNNIGVDGKGDCDPGSKGARSDETNRKSGSLSQNASKGTNLMQQQQQQQQQQMSCECSVGNHQQPEKRQDDQQQQQQSSRSRRKSSINNSNSGGGSNPKLPRSSSQDSVSSTDTMLLPSDSIIYSDINQAYALSRHRSRYQQTSFERTPKNDSAGQHDYQSAGGRIVPTTTTTTTITTTKPSSPTSAVSKQQQQHQLVSNQVDAISGQRADRVADRSGGGDGGSGGEMKSQHQQRQQRLTTNRHQTSSTTTLRRQTSVADERAASGFDATGSNDLVRDQESQQHQQQQQRIGDASDVASGADRRKSNATGNDTDSRRRQSTGGAGGVGDKDGQRRRESQHFANTQDDDRKGADGASLSSGTGSRASISRASLGAARRSSEHSAQVADRTRRSLHGSRSKSGEENQSNDLIDGQATSNNNNNSNNNNSLQRNESETTAPSISTIEYNLASTAGSGGGGGNQDYRSSERPECRQEQNTSGADNNRSIKRNSLIDHQGRHNSNGGDEHDGDDDDDDDDEDEHVSSGCQHRAHRSEARNSTTAETGSDDRQQEAIAMRRRASRSQPPSASSQRHHQSELTSACHKEAHKKRASDHQHDQHHYNQQHQQQQQQQHFQQQLKPLGAGGVGVRRSVSVSPSLSNSVNIRHILENVAQIEGNFVDAPLAYKVAMDALDSPCWSTKVEGILALIRLVAHHAQYIVQPTSGVASGRLHEIVLKLTNEIGNLRSTVARSAIFALGDFCAKLGRSIEPEMDIICRALLQKSTENTAFIRDDIKRALNEMVNSMTPWRLTNSLIANGAQHKSANVRRMASQFVAQLVVDRLGAPKCLVGSREISSTLLPAASKFAQDNSPYTRYYGRLILSKLMYHSAFDRLLRRNLTSTLYRSTVGIIESIRRRGPGELPQGD